MEWGVFGMAGLAEAAWAMSVLMVMASVLAVGGCALLALLLGSRTVATVAVVLVVVTGYFPAPWMDLQPLSAETLEAMEEDRDAREWVGAARGAATMWVVACLGAAATAIVLWISPYQGVGAYLWKRRARHAAPILVLVGDFDVEAVFKATGLRPTKFVPWGERAPQGTVARRLQSRLGADRPSADHLRDVLGQLDAVDPVSLVAVVQQRAGSMQLVLPLNEIRMSGSGSDLLQSLARCGCELASSVFEVFERPASPAAAPGK